MIFLFSSDMKKNCVVVVSVSIIVISISRVKVWLIWLLLVKLWLIICFMVGGRFSVVVDEIVRVSS